MNTKPEFPIIVESLETGPSQTNQTNSVKKVFVEPELTSPVDVLEATTYFQFTDSGATN